MGNRNLSDGLKEMTAEEKQNMINAAVRYDDAKKNNGDVQGACNEMRSILKNIEQKYDVTIFVPNFPEEALMDKVVEKLLLKVKEKEAPQPAPQQDTAPQPAANPGTAPATPQSDLPHYTCTFKSLDEANAWLANYKNIVITHLQVHTSRVGLDIEQIRLEYIVKPNSAQYQLTELKKHRFFVQSKPKKVREEWQLANPQLQFVSSLKKTWGFSLIGSSVGFFRYIKEKYIILYRYN